MCLMNWLGCFAFLKCYVIVIAQWLSDNGSYYHFIIYLRQQANSSLICWVTAVKNSEMKSYCCVWYQYHTTVTQSGRVRMPLLHVSSLVSRHG